MRTALPHQIEAVAHIHSHPRALLADDMGLGKTTVVLLQLREDPANKRAIVVCPSNVRDVWEAQAKECGISTFTVTGEAAIEGYPKARLIIISYGLVIHHLDWLRGMVPGAVWMDECQDIKHRNSQRGWACAELARGVPRVVGMSGTPLENNLAELWPILNILWPDEFSSFRVFANEHCGPVRKPWGWEYKGAVDVPRLREQLLRLGLFRRTKEILGDDFPDLVRKIIRIDISDPPQYEEANTNFLKWLARRDLKRAKAAAKAEMLAKVGYLKRLAIAMSVDNKIRWVKRWMAANPGEKVCLFAVHDVVMDRIRKAFGDDCVTVQGKTSRKARKEAVERFQNDPACLVFAGKITVAGVGISLTAARSAFFFECEWRPTLHQQAEARVWRIPQKRDCYIYYLIAKGTIEEKLCSVLQNKYDVVGGVMDGRAAESLPVYALLMRQMQIDAAALRGLWA